MLDAAIMADVPREVDSSFDQIVRDRQTQVLRTANGILGNWADAEDVAQEVFVRLHRHGLTFPSQAALGAWIYRVTVNLCIDRSRASRPLQELPEELPLQAASAESVAIREQQKRRLVCALALLPVRERAAVVLREMEGLSTAEVAHVLGSSEGTVRSQVSKGVARLRELLSRDAL